MTEQSVTIPAKDGAIDAFTYHPNGAGPWPAVILHTDGRGLRPTFRAHGERLAAAGYYVLVPNLFYRATPAPIIDPSLSILDEQTRAKLADLRNRFVTVDGVRLDHEALFAFLDKQPEAKGPKLGLVGYCFSGAIVVRAVADFPERVSAAASFHGGNLATAEPDSPHLRVGDIRASLYFGYAADDPSLPQEQIDRLEAALRAAGVSFRSEHYARRHGFGVADSPVYENSVGEHHWEQLIAHLNAAFEPAIGA